MDVGNTNRPSVRVYGQMIEWECITYWKKFERKRWWANLRNYPGVCLEEALRESTINLRIASAPTRIQTWYQSVTNQKRYPCRLYVTI